MDDEKALLFIREEIDSIDSELISLLESRLNLSLEIGKVKKRMDKNSINCNNWVCSWSMVRIYDWIRFF